MKNSQKIAAGVLAAVVVTSCAAAPQIFRPENSFVGLTASAANDAITIANGTVVPDTVVQGSNVGVQGIVSSEDSNISSVTVGIYDSARKLVTGKSALPKSKSYDISKLDSYVGFSKLAPGSYTYMVFATNGTSTNYVLTNKSFTVTPAGNTAATTTDTMSISSGTSLPGGLKRGRCVQVKGTVTSATSNITSVTVGVFDQNGKMVTGQSAQPNAKSYNVNKLDNFVAFDKLQNGTYTYKVIATNAASKDYVIVSQNFIVSDDGSAKAADNSTVSAPVANSADALVLTEGTEVPSQFTKGRTFTVKGKVTSANTNIESLTVGIYDTAGKLISGKTAIPNAKTYDLFKLDNYIEFDKLPDGTYAYMVFASNGTNKNFVMVNKAFTVGTGQVASDAVAIANGSVMPAALEEGKGYTVKGTLASAKSNIESVTVGVYDQSGKMVTGKTVQPNAKTYNLSKLDNDVLFNRLPAGNYHYKVIVSNAANKNFELVNQSFSVSNGKDIMVITDGTVVPDTLKKGSCLPVKGVVSSAESNMTAVTVGVYDSNKKLVTGKSAVPNAKYYDISKLDNFIEFNKLPDGNYTYMVFATNAGNSNYVIVNKNFSVGNATSATAGTGVSQSNKGIYLTGGTAIPETISQGQPVAVRGVITSDNTIKALTVAVYNSNDKLVTSKSVAPNSKSYDLSKLDRFIEFNRLGTGKYTYRVAVTTTANKDVTADRQKFTVK